MQLAGVVLCYESRVQTRKVSQCLIEYLYRVYVDVRASHHYFDVVQHFPSIKKN